MKVAVTGGRFWNRPPETFSYMDQVHEEIGITLLIHGDCPQGADRLCKEWAESHGIPTDPYPANWDRDGKYSAGKIRNQQMIDEGHPELLIAFPGENGTADMCARAKRARIPIRRWPK